VIRAVEDGGDQENMTSVPELAMAMIDGRFMMG
jgi:hypothetical protein